MGLKNRFRKAVKKVTGSDWVADRSVEVGANVHKYTDPLSTEVNKYRNTHDILPKAPEPPPIPSPAEMPDEEERRKSRRRAIARMRGGSGRMSTILSGGDDSLGG